MNHEEEIHTLHRRQSRTKFVVVLIIGFLALLTYLLISISKQIAEGESIDFRSRASEMYVIDVNDVSNNNDTRSDSSQTTSSDTQSDTGSCYSIGGSSGGSFGLPYCRILSFKCTNGYNDGKTKEEMEKRIMDALKARYGGDIVCDVAKGTCEIPGKSCPGFGNVIEPILKEFCKCPPTSGGNPGSGSQDPQTPATQPSTVSQCITTTAQFYRRGSCSQFEKCAPPYDPFIVTCKDASGKTCRTGQPADQTCTGKTGATCNAAYQQRANAFCGL